MTRRRRRTDELDRRIRSLEAERLRPTPPPPRRRRTDPEPSGPRDSQPTREDR